MILKFLRKVPAGMMIVPLLIGSFMNTFFPEALKIGSFTTATFSSAVATTAGNAVAVPAAVGIIDPAWAPYVGGATTQVAAAVVVTAILAPLMTNYWAKKYGCPQFDKIKEEMN